MNIPIPRSVKSVVLVVGSAILALAIFSTVAVASMTDNLFGYTWSTNIGWVRVNNCTTPTVCDVVTSSDSGSSGYGVTIAPTGNERAMTGYAWSSNIGWISFNSTATTGCPASSPASACQARVLWGTATPTNPVVNVVGWARACSVFTYGCSGALRPSYQTGGWDGWIALGDTNHTDDATVNFGVTYNTVTNNLTGYAWGASVVGWLDFSTLKVDTSNQCPNGVPGSECWCNVYVDDASCQPTQCPDGTSAPTLGQCPNCAPGSQCWCDVMDDSMACQNPVQCPDGSTVQTLDQCPTVTCNPGDPCWCETHDTADCQNNPPQCSDGFDNDGDGYIDYSGGDPGCGSASDNDETDPTGPGTPSQCTNIPDDPNTADDGIVITFPPYRQLSDGRCLCVAGYVMNAKFQCVKPIYNES